MAHRLSGRSAATAATAGNAAAGLWNPHTTQRITLREFWICANTAPAALAGVAIRRTTARGTATLTATPVIANDTHRGAVSVSVSVLDLTYSVQPTLETGANMWQWTFAAAAASGVSGPIEIDIPPGTGIAWVNIGAVIFPAADFNVAWTED